MIQVILILNGSNTMIVLKKPIFGKLYTVVIGHLWKDRPEGALLGYLDNKTELTHFSFNGKAE
uniref:Bm1171 n=1 Tax=Brugia malayi TaxID=6279 RepID=A0A1I9G6U2_BRUMA|nr:Bm1171 [Brugia malayi]